MLSKARTVRRVVSLLFGTAFRADPWRALLVIIMLPVGMVSMNIAPVFLRAITDGVVQRDSRQLLVGAIGCAVVATMSWVISMTGYTLSVGLGERASLHFDTRVIELAAGLPYLEHHERPEYANKLALLRGQGGALGQGISSVALGVGQIVAVLTMLGLLASLHPLLLLLPLFALPTIGAFVADQMLVQRASERTAESGRAALHLFTLTTQATSAKELRIFGLGRELLRRHRARREEITSAMTRAQVKGAGISVVSWTIYATGVVGSVALIGFGVMKGNRTPGDLVMAMTLVDQVAGQVMQAAYMSQWMVQSLKTVARYIWLEDYGRDLAFEESSAVPAPSRIERGLSLRDVRFRYPGTETEVLKGVTLEIPAGATVAVIGENGAGKTSLVKLLCRFYEPTSGVIEVDGTDLRALTIDSWRARLSGAFQDHTPFEFSARDVVRVGAEADDDTVRAALERAAATDVLEELPAGLDTQLGRMFEGGVELSGGQWQKLALGRAMLRDSPLLLVLDEPTAALDAQTEHALFERYAGAASRASANGGITLFVSHRFSTVRMADLIVVLEDGKVSEYGTHAELMATPKLYAELYELQARAYR